MELEGLFILGESHLERVASDLLNLLEKISGSENVGVWQAADLENFVDQDSTQKILGANIPLAKSGDVIYHIKGAVGLRVRMFVV